ncbi:MAG: CCA tRNA nucleotidyltransferase, partial [Candidatus Levyibacteriota bacterium]
MATRLPEEVGNVYKTFVDNGHEIYLVGGGVRNIFLEKEANDWDMTTSATPEEMLQLFPDGFYDNKFGTVGIPIVINNEQWVVEVTTFRTERNYTDNRHPENVTWGKTVEEDLERRDFTMNAIAIKLKNISPNMEIMANAEIIDPYNGQKDIANKIICAVGNPNKRFKEDALRLLRAVRFAAELSFTIEEKTWNAMLEDSMLLEAISAERIRVELLKMLASDFPYEGIMLLKNAKLLEHILPELLEGIGVSQERPGRHHTTDVFTHNVDSLKF